MKVRKDFEFTVYYQFTSTLKAINNAGYKWSKVLCSPAIPEPATILLLAITTQLVYRPALLNYNNFENCSIKGLKICHEQI